MPARPEPPDEGTLRAFLLGTLPAERVDQVRAWLDADSACAARLGRLVARDALTDALVGTPPPTAHDLGIERVIRRVADSLNTPSESFGDTPAEPGNLRQQHAPPLEPTDWPPARLGSYRILRELGHGGMGFVFEAEDEKLNRRVAVKVLTPELAHKPGATARFLREARAVAAVEHENVVPILHVDEEVPSARPEGVGGRLFLVMPLLKGEPLLKRLRREGALPVPEVVRIGREILAGLGAAHARGLVHRDVKPANVWLDADTGRARVLDFGLARQGDGADALTETGALQGTPAYMAPEQLDGLPADARSDLFAVGAILYECTTGSRAFAGATITAILKAVATHNPPAPTAVNPAVPPELSELILKLLSKNPAARPASAAEAASALAGVPTPANGTTTATWVDRARPAVPTRPRAVWLAGGALLVALVAVGVWLGTRPPKGESGPVTAPEPAPAVRYKGKVEVLVERNAQLLRLNESGALPLRQSDKFRIEGEVDPPAYLYVVWVDPERDVTPVYPWVAKDGWGSRPVKEEPVSKLSLPRNVGNTYRAPEAKPGVATMVMFATAAPLAEPDDVVKGWFESLPELPLPPGGDGVAVWFDDFAPTRDPFRLRAGLVEVASDDAFARWQGQLQKSLGNKVSFQTAVSFARTGRK